MNLLFVCSKNQWRSPTAEALYRRYDGVNARSAGTGSSARRKVSAADLDWADMIFVMEDKHRARLRANFRDHLNGKTVHVLDIPDIYGFMDPELVDVLQESVAPLLEARQNL